MYCISAKNNKTLMYQPAAQWAVEILQWNDALVLSEKNQCMHDVKKKQTPVRFWMRLEPSTILLLGNSAKNHTTACML